MDELNLIKQLLLTHQQVAEAIAQVLTQKQLAATEQKWVPLEDGAAALGPAFSAAKLREDINTGWLKHGKHYINTSNGKRPNYAVCVAALRKLYATPPEQRRPG
ncbi:MAG: hypothetical protein ACFCVB_10090 [Nodosilinea sp.]